MSDALGAHQPEPRPEPREPARFARELDPMPKRRGGSTGTFNKGLPQCGFCKRRDGTHSAKCPRKAGRHSRAAKPTRRAPKADEAPAVQSQRFDRGAAMLRARLEDELADTEAYADSIRAALGRL